MQNKQKRWYNLNSEEVIKSLETDEIVGLWQEEVEKRKAEYGLNELEGKKKKSLIIRFLEQFKDFMIIVLIIAAIISGIVGYTNGEGFTDTIIIMIVIIANAVIGVMQENKAEKSLEALKKLSEEYKTFTKINDGDKGSVKFIMITDSLKKENYTQKTQSNENAQNTVNESSRTNKENETSGEK